MKKYTAIILLMTGIGWACMAQSLDRQVISSTGDFSSSGNLQLSSTVGEIATETHISGSVTLTQGFQQPDSKGNVGIEDLEISLNYSVFPNPTAGKLHLHLTSENPVHFSIQLTDMSGRQTGIGVQDLHVMGTVKEELDLSSLANGQYVLLLIDATHQIQKALHIMKIE